VAKELHCGDVMTGCKHVISGDNEEEVMRQAAEHAREAHGVEKIDEETAKQVKAAIRDA